MLGREFGCLLVGIIKGYSGGCDVLGPELRNGRILRQCEVEAWGMCNDTPVNAKDLLYA